MIAFRVTIALGALLFATAPAVGVRIHQWSIDPRVEVDPQTLLYRLREVLSKEGDTQSSPVTALPMRAGVSITVVEKGTQHGLLVHSTDLEADRTVRSTIHPPADHLRAMEVLVKALTTDLSYLKAARDGFPSSLTPAPSLSHVIEGERIAELIGTTMQELGKIDVTTEVNAEIIDIAAHPHGLSILFENSFIDLGPHFELTTATAISLIKSSNILDIISVHHEIARTTWTHDLLTFESDRSLNLFRINDAGNTSILNLPSGSRRFDTVPNGGLVAITDQGPIFFQATERGIDDHPISVAARFITAMDIDRHRRLTLYDAYDRRVVIVNLDGQELSSIRPQVNPRLLPFPHALAVLADGSILLGGSNTIWAFDRSGRPYWRLSRFQAGRESLPSQFSIEPSASGMSFYILDGPRARILRFDSLSTKAPLIAMAEETLMQRFTQLANSALIEATSKHQQGNLKASAEIANFAAHMFQYALKENPKNEELVVGNDRSVNLRNDAESTIFQEHFLSIDPQQLIINADNSGDPVQLAVTVMNDGITARTGVKLITKDLNLSFGTIHPGRRVTRLLKLDFFDSLLAIKESRSIELGVILSADEPGRTRPRRMFLTLPLHLNSPPKDQS